MISSIVAPAFRFSNTVETGVRVSRKTHSPLRLPGILSTAGHCDQSRPAIIYAPFFQNMRLLPAELNQPGAAGKPLAYAPVALKPQRGKRGGLLLNCGVWRYRKDQPRAITCIRREAGLEELVKKSLDGWRYGNTDPISGT